jgi:hypothetical protein
MKKTDGAYIMLRGPNGKLKLRTFKQLLEKVFYISTYFLNK